MGEACVTEAPLQACALREVALCLACVGPAHHALDEDLRVHPAVSVNQF